MKDFLVGAALGIGCLLAIALLTIGMHHALTEWIVPLIGRTWAIGSFTIIGVALLGGVINS